MSDTEQGHLATMLAPPSAASRYAEAHAQAASASTRLRELEAKALDGLLTEQEETEQLRLERRVSNLAPVVERLKREVALERDRVDIAQVQATWQGLVAAKQQAFTDFAQAVVALRQAWQGLLRANDAQEAAVARLPAFVRERLSFPDSNTLGMRVLSRMPAAAGWLQIAQQAEGPFAVPPMAQLTDVDPGVQPIPERLINRFLDEAQAWKRRHNA